MKFKILIREGGDVEYHIDGTLMGTAGGDEEVEAMGGMFNRIAALHGEDVECDEEWKHLPGSRYM